MRGNRRAILIDVFERKLDPKSMHTSLDKSGRIVKHKKNLDAKVHQEEKVVFASTQKSQSKNDKLEENFESNISDIVNDLKPADIVEEQDGFLIPSIATKVANGSVIEEEIKSEEIEIVADDESTTKKTKKKKK